MTATLLGDRYQVGDTLGFGGMSEVHRGRDLRLGRDVAIKVLRADLARDPTFQARFRREAQNAASLNHPAIVAVYDTGETLGEAGPVPYIVMEYVDGETLRDLLKREGPLPPKRAMEIVADICAALDFSHRHGIVHRDVKPANVMLTRAGAVKVMDFGIARAVADGQATVTATAAVIGTAQYLSPEQARGEAVDARSDVYATGCVLYELLTGSPPFTGDSPVAIAYQHVREDPKPPSMLRPGLPPSLDAIVLKALNKNPLNRYQTAAEMRSDLVRALSGQAVHATPLMPDAEKTELMRQQSVRVVPVVAPPPLLAPPSILNAQDNWDEPESSRAKRVWGFVGIGLLCLALLGGAVWFTLRITGQPEPLPRVLVPDLKGMTPTQAAAALQQNHLVLAQAQKTAPSDDSQKGKVVDQSPSANTQVTQQSEVTITVGEGVQSVTVPNVVGMDAQTASDTVKNANLVYKEMPVYSQSPKGRVEKQTPNPNTSTTPGATVTVYISQGPEMTVIPDQDQIVGKNVNDATATLKAAKLQVVTQTTPSTAPQNQVLSMDQKPGAQVPINTVVTLKVSDFSLMTVPDLTNMTPDQAIAALKQAGWTSDPSGLVQTTKEDPNAARWGRILSQQPKSKDVVGKNSVVGVTVATEPHIPMPDLTGLTQGEAQARLSGLGWYGQLTVKVHQDIVPPTGQANLVFGQSPAPSGLILVTDPVTIDVYPNPPPPPPKTTPTTAPATSTAAATTSAAATSHGGGGGGHGGGG
jgi:serine/threonine-protein kinase